ncbi:hypothetical protein Tco_0721303 [Tanacetum coccineum]
MLSETRDLDIEGSKSWEAKHDEIFTMQYPYVQKVVASYHLLVDDLMKISPDVPPPPPKDRFDHVVAAIEESKDLSVLSFDELVGFLQAYEARINRSVIKEEDKAFQIKGDMDYCYQRGRGQSRGEASYAEEDEGQDDYVFMVEAKT